MLWVSQLVSCVWKGIMRLLRAWSFLETPSIHRFPNLRHTANLVESVAAFWVPVWGLARQRIQDPKSTRFGSILTFWGPNFSHCPRFTVIMPMESIKILTLLLEVHVCEWLTRAKVSPVRERITCLEWMLKWLIERANSDRGFSNWKNSLKGFVYRLTYVNNQLHGSESPWDQIKTCR